MSKGSYVFLWSDDCHHYIWDEKTAVAWVTHTNSPDYGQTNRSIYQTNLGHHVGAMDLAGARADETALAGFLAGMAVGD